MICSSFQLKIGGLSRQDVPNATATVGKGTEDLTVFPSESAYAASMVQDGAEVILIEIVDEYIASHSKSKQA